MKVIFRTILVVLVTIPVFASSTPGEATLYRDNWGVPYIYAATDGDAAYALGYAQAEDRLGDLYMNVRTGIGRMSEAFGDSFVEQDYAMLLSRVPERCEAYWDSAPAAIKTISEQFIKGVEAYIADHPEKAPAWSLDLHPWQTFAIGQAMILRWPLGQIQDELRNTRNANDFGSNQWAVAPKRSAEGVPILLTDPHLTWEGMAVFYEANVVGDNLAMHGYFLVGSPLLAFGHNGHVGWAPTTGGPDTADVFELELNPQNTFQYKHQGQWKNARLETIVIPVKDKDPVRRPAGYTELGPLFAEPDFANLRAYAGNTPYFQTDELVEQFYQMCAATNTQEFYEALGMNQYMEQNIMYAGRDGNIGYVRTGRVPIRSDELDWSKAVPASDPRSVWGGIHPIEDLVQIVNPPQGYMQNCNISPANMMKNSPMTPDKYRSYIYNVSWDSNNTRGMRALELLDANDSITKEQAKAIAFDVYDVLAKPWRKALADALEAVDHPDKGNADFQAAVERLLAWDGEFRKDSEGAPLVMYWRQFAQPKLDVGALARGENLAASEKEALLTAVSEAVARMKELYGDRVVTWGDIYKVGRSGKYFPVDGAVLGRGSYNTRTLFNVGARELERGSGVYVANNGSMSMALMFFYEEGIEAYTLTPWGQSADPESPHHLDQAEKLYTQRQFKRVWPDEAALQDHVESKRVLKTM